MHLAAPNSTGQQRAILIFISEKIEGYAKDFLELLDQTWANNPQIPPFFQEPSDERKIAIWNKCLLSCEDYYTTASREYRLLKKGIVVHHGKMPGLMARLLIEVIDEQIVHLVMATSTLSEGVNLPFETVLVPSLQRGNRGISAGEFKNLVGRAGRPGFGTEGRSLVLVPERPQRMPTDSEERKIYRKKIEIRDVYDRLVRKLQEPPIDTSDTANSPLAQLLEHLRAKWRELTRNGSDAEFLNWLEQTAPITVQPGNTSEEDAIESLDSLDNVLLAAIVEVEQISAGEMEPSQLEAELRRLWEKTYAYYANQNQAELQQFFVHRGKALRSNIYPSYHQRKRLYKTSLPPRSGDRLLSLYPRIKEHLATGVDYLSRSPEERFTYIRDAIQLVGEVNSFSLKGQGKNSWEVILRWWLQYQHAPQKPPETQISSWHKLINDNFTYRFNWGLGSVIALAMEESLGDRILEPSSLNDWREIGLPWIVFWIKELIIWGTLDPVAAYLLAKVEDITTRSQAERLSQGYYESESVVTLEPNDRLDPRRIREWTQQAFIPTRQESARLRPRASMEVELLRDFSRSSKHKWRVIPVEVEGELHWLDPAGFPLAKCERPETWQQQYLTRYDFELDSRDRVVTSRSYL